MGLDNPIHLAFILLLVLLVFGAKRLPEMGRSLGSGMRGFKESITGTDTPTAHIEEAAATPASGIPASEPVVEGSPVRPVA
jgi:sec-independent protein translocase protein TatA